MFKRFIFKAGAMMFQQPNFSNNSMFPNNNQNKLGKINF
jgi:hypothetical protein